MPPKPPGKPAGKKGPADPKAAAKAMSAAIASIPDESKVDGKQLWMATDALQKAKALRNYFQLERDKINNFWEVSRRDLEAVKAELRQKEREKAEMYERHQIETKVFKQKVRHTLYEHQVQLTQLKIEAEETLRNKQQEHNHKEEELERDIRAFKLNSREQELHLIENRNAQLLAQEREASEQLSDYERQVKETHLRYERKIRALRESMDKRRNDEINAIERRKEEHVASLRESHDKAFADIKEYFNEITSSNLETIRTLKDEVYSRKRTESHNEKAMFEIAQTNKRLTEPLTKAQKQKKQLETELANYECDRAALKTTKQELSQLEVRMKTLTWEHEVLGQRYEKLDEDRRLIFDRYNDLLQDIQQKAVFKRVLIHRKLEVAKGQLEKKEVQIGEIVKRAGGGGTQETAELQQNIESLLSRKDRTIAQLEQLLKEITERHEVVVAAYSQYARQNGVPVIQAS